MVRQLTASAPSFDTNLTVSYREVVARHDATRDALLDQTVAALRGVGLGLVSRP
jgi:hypothetical protein